MPRVFIVIDGRSEIQKMMKMSEKEGDRGDVDLFISSLKLSLPLFATAHKIDYVKVACNFLVNWELDSPALKAIYRRFLFTQLGPTRYAMHSDLFVEEANKRTRNHASKIVFRGSDAVLEQAVYQDTDTVVQEHDGNIIEWFWFLKRRQPKIRWSLRESNVVRCSAGPGVCAGGTGGRFDGSLCKEVSTVGESGLDDALINSSSVMTEVGLEGLGGSGEIGGDWTGRDGCVGGGEPDFGVGILKETLRWLRVSLSGGIIVTGRALGLGYSRGLA
jgi:hypothetical protein